MSEIWYVAKSWSHTIDEIEVFGETPKFVKTKHGRQAKDSDGVWICKTRDEAVEQRLGYFRLEVEQAEGRARRARESLQMFQQLEAARLKTIESASQ